MPIMKDILHLWCCTKILILHSKHVFWLDGARGLNAIGCWIIVDHKGHMNCTICIDLYAPSKGAWNTYRLVNWSLDGKNLGMAVNAPLLEDAHERCRSGHLFWSFVCVTEQQMGSAWRCKSLWMFLEPKFAPQIEICGAKSEIPYENSKTYYE